MTKVSSKVGTTITKSLDSFVKPPSLPTTPNIGEPFSRANSIHLTRLGLIFFSKFPPPTEKIKSPSFEENLLTFSQLEYDVSQPSSLTLAVNSETLSDGV